MKRIDKKITSTHMLQQAPHLRECKQENAQSQPYLDKLKMFLDAKIYVYINNNIQTIKTSKYSA